MKTEMEMKDAVREEIDWVYSQLRERERGWLVRKLAELRVEHFGLDWSSTHRGGARKKAKQ